MDPTTKASLSEIGFTAQPHIEGKAKTSEINQKTMGVSTPTLAKTPPREEKACEFKATSKVVMTDVFSAKISSMSTQELWEELHRITPGKSIEETSNLSARLQEVEKGLEGCKYAQLKEDGTFTTIDHKQAVKVLSPSEMERSLLKHDHAAGKVRVPESHLLPDRHILAGLEHVVIDGKHHEIHEGIGAEELSQYRELSQRYLILSSLITQMKVMELAEKAMPNLRLTRTSIDNENQRSVPVKILKDPSLPFVAKAFISLNMLEDNRKKERDSEANAQEKDDKAAAILRDVVRTEVKKYGDEVELIKKEGIQYNEAPPVA